MKENRLLYANLSYANRNQARVFLAIAGGNVNDEIVEVVIVTKPFDQERLRSVLETMGPSLDVGGECPDRRPGEVAPSHEPSRASQEDFEALPPLAPRVRRDNFLDPDGEQ